MRWRVVVFAVVACREPASTPPATSPSVPSSSVPGAHVTPKPGDPLELRVRVVRADGQPARSIKGRVYHTDASGYYLRKPDGSEAGGEHARLKFDVVTDGDGVFVLTTIVPAPYPQGGPPAHVHMHIPPEHPDDLTIMLDSDPRLDRERIARMARTWIGRVHVAGARWICDATVVAP